MTLSDDRRVHAAEKLLSAALVLYAFEMVVGGPGLLNGGLLSPRFFLGLLVAFAAVNYLIRARLSLEKWQVLLFGLFASFLFIWAILIPLDNSVTQLKYAVRECLFFLSAFAGILLIGIAQTRPAVFKSSGRTALFALDFVALAILLIWIAGAIDSSMQIPMSAGLRVLLRPFGPSNDLAVYVGPMPDGAFRVMWITSTLICLGVLYALQRGMTLRIGLYIAACAASYARGLWIACAMGALLLIAIELSYNRHGIDLWIRRVKGIALGLLISAVVLYLHNQAPGARLSFEDSATELRLMQMNALLNMWRTSPLLGHGFGAFSPDIIRNPNMPWAYEMTYPALLMKTGLAGALMFLCCVGVLIKGSIRHGHAYRFLSPYLLAVLIYAGTNPYLLNIVGISTVFCILILFACQSTGEQAPEPALG